MIDWQVAFTVAVCAVAALILWWFRDRHLAEQRGAMRALFGLSEDIVAARSPSQVLRLLVEALPQMSKVSGVRLYLLDPKTATLSRVPSSLDPEPRSLALQDDAAPAICARNRTPLTVPDTARSALYDAASESDRPKSAMFVPMIAEDEVLGVLELYHSGGVRRFNANQRAAAQHLANQIGMTLKLQAQHSVREQLSRTEKLAAAGKLISGVLAELKEPLQSVASRAAHLKARSEDGDLREELESISAEADRASATVSRLLKFSPDEQPGALPVNLSELLSELIEFRAPGWRQRGIRLRNLLTSAPLTVFGSRAQLEQVFLNLLVMAEETVGQAADKSIAVEARPLADRAIVGITFSSPAVADSSAALPPAGHSAEAAELGLVVCRGIAQSHGGEIRAFPGFDGGSRFEIELPLAPAATREPAELRHQHKETARRLTVLVVEPERASQQQLVTLLSARGHRVVPAMGTGEAMDFAQRLHFDVAFSSASLAGTNWVDFYDKIRHLVSAFVLLTEGHVADISRAFRSPDSFVLAKPVDAAEVDRLLSSVEAASGRRPIPQPN